MSSILPKKSTKLLLRLATYVKPFWLTLLIGLLANIGYSLIDAIFTYLMRPFMDKGFIHVDLAFVKQIPLIILLGITARGIMGALGGYCMTAVARSVVKNLRQKVFSHAVKLPADYYDEATSGHLLSKILYDVEQVAQVSADALTDLVQNICLLVGLLTVMMILCWQLSLMFLLSVPLIGFIVNYTNKRIRRISHKIQQSMGEVTEIAAETIEGYAVVRIYGGEDYETQKFSKATENARANDMKVAVSKALNVFGVQFIIAIAIAMIIFAAIQLSTVIQISAGAFLAIIAAMLQLIKPMKTLTTLNATIQRGLAGAESVFQLLDKPLEKTEGLIVPTAIKGSICFDNVNFKYRNGPRVLHDLSFTVNPGEIIALVGHSGSGKSTIAKLIPHFYTVEKGEIRIDGYPIDDLNLAYLRKNIAFVGQQVTLFNDTLANNIAYGRFDASIEEVKEAAKLAYASEFIERLPKGYDTVIGENGILLSGGQRQRIAIARAILKKAPLLILDEATSALDTESERFIQAALTDLFKDRTTIVIAHRLSTIQQADKIIVMHQGRIVEQGTHETLLALNGHYHALNQAQMTRPASLIEPEATLA